LAAPQVHDLSGIRILASLTPEQRRDFEISCRWKRFGAEEPVIDQSDSTRDIYFIARGRVRVINFTISGKEVALEDIVAGGHFGELAAIDGQPRSSTVVAVEDSDIAKMAPERFLKLMRTHPSVAHEVMKALAGVIRTATERIVDLSTLGANNRVHGELLRQARIAKRDDNVAIIRPIPVHGEMASRASTTRETVARVFSDLTRQGIIKRERDALVITDYAALENLVDEVRGA
jgi:CRP/FNR family transcriptional regulator, cyclic AMP receptor protein